jgi:hypothetical protein
MVKTMTMGGCQIDKPALVTARLAAVVTLSLSAAGGAGRSKGDLCNPCGPHWLLRVWALVLGFIALGALSGCGNSPWEAGAAEENTLYTAMQENTPRHLDSTASYWSNDTAVTYQVYEPLYGYHYLKRPYQLVPKAAAAVVAPRYVDKDGKPLPADAPGELIAESIYDIPIRKGILYQPHPAFAKDVQGHPGRSSTLAPANWWPKTLSTPSSAMPPRASRHPSTASSRNMCWA